MLKGSKITRIAVADMASGHWNEQELQPPADGQAVPIVGPDVVVYRLGRKAYAYGVKAKKWAVVELAEGVKAAPLVGLGTATIEDEGHIYSFAAESGKWEHVDVRAVLEMGTAKK